VLARHHQWLQDCGMFGEGVAATAVTWTSWDLAVRGTSGMARQHQGQRKARWMQHMLDRENCHNG
jgi:hypothetical protein